MLDQTLDTKLQVIFFFYEIWNWADAEREQSII